MGLNLNSNGGANAISSALGWIERTLLGTVATAAAVIAIAVMGLLMLSGRLDVRRSVRVIIGCFIIFGASTIAAGLHSAISGTDEREAMAPELPPPPPPAPPQQAQQTQPSNYDPYAGAGLSPTQ